MSIINWITIALLAVTFTTQAFTWRSIRRTRRAAKQSAAFMARANERPHPTFDNQPSSHEQAVEEARRLTERLSYLQDLIKRGGSAERVIPAVERDGSSAADDQGGTIPVRRIDPEWENLVLLKSINDSLLNLIELVRSDVVGLSVKSDMRH